MRDEEKAQWKKRPNLDLCGCTHTADLANSGPKGAALQRALNSGYDSLEVVEVWSAGFRYLMCSAMEVSMLVPGLLLLLAAGVCEGLEAADRLESVVSPEDHGSRLRGLWRLHMKESKGKGFPPHPIRGVVKQQLLYCRVGIGYHLQILPDGSVGGVHNPTEYCWLKVFAMKHGVVGIRGVKSGLYLCMKGEGIAYGAEQFSDDCLFKENLEENHYTTYSSLSHPGLYLALSHKGEVKRGTNVGRHQPCTHFLPRRTRSSESTNQAPGSKP